MLSLDLKIFKVANIFEIVCNLLLFYVLNITYFSTVNAFPVFLSSCQSLKVGRQSQFSSLCSAFQCNFILVKEKENNVSWKWKPTQYPFASVQVSDRIALCLWIRRKEMKVLWELGNNLRAKQKRAAKVVDMEKLRSPVCQVIYEPSERESFWVVTLIQYSSWKWCGIHSRTAYVALSRIGYALALPLPFLWLSIRLPSTDKSPMSHEKQEGSYRNETTWDCSYLIHALWDNDSFVDLLPCLLAHYYFWLYT